VAKYALESLCTVAVWWLGAYDKRVIEHSQWREYSRLRYDAFQNKISSYQGKDFDILLGYRQLNIGAEKDMTHKLIVFNDFN